MKLYKIICLLGMYLLGIFSDRAYGQNGVWTSHAPLPARVQGASSGTINGQIYVVAGLTGSNGGGSDAGLLQIYHPAANTWTNGADLPAGFILPNDPETFSHGFYAATAGVIAGQLYVAGGQTTAGDVANLEAYDPVANTWTNLATMPFADAALCSGVLNGKLYVVAANSQKFAAYDPSTNGWTTLAPIPTSREWAGAAVVNGLLYVIGGQSGADTTNLVEAYDAVANQWTNKAPLPMATSQAGVGVINGIIYVVGGLANPRDSTSVLNLVQAYNPVTDTWSFATNLPAARRALTASVANGVLYVLGGNLSGNGSAVTTNEAFAPMNLTNLVISPPNPAIVPGANQSFTATGYFAEGSTNVLAATNGLVWSSSNPSVATIDPNGLATGLTAGTTTITATVGNYSGSTALTVTPGYFSWTTNNGAITITGYSGTNPIVVIPSVINGLPVTGIGDSVFQNRSSVISVIIPNSVTTIGADVFSDDPNLTSVSFPTNVTNIGDGEFLDCFSLTNFTIPDSVTSIGYEAFAWAGLTSLTLPNVNSIGESAFVDSTLTNITIGVGVTNAGIPYLLPETMSESSVATISVATNNPQFSSLGGVLFDKNQTTLLVVPPHLAGPYTIPASVVDIGGNAFANVITLTNIAIPDTVTNLEPYAFANQNVHSISIGQGITSIGNHVFYQNQTLVSITLPNSVTSIGDYAFKDCPALRKINLPNSITNLGTYAFGGDTSLPNIIIPNHLATIKAGALSACQSFTSITIPDSVTAIEDWAFAGDFALTNVIISAHATNLGSSTFDADYQLNTIYFKGNAPTPTNDLSVFDLGWIATTAIAFYFPGTTGWGATFDGIRTAPILIAPPLGMSTYGSQPAVFFPTASGTNFVLQMTTNLASGQWVTVSNGIPISGIIITNPANNAFFRLH